MKKIFLMISVLALMASCNNATQKEKKTNDSAQAEQVMAVSVDDFFADPDSFNGKIISINGLVTHVCKHGGQKLFVVGQDSAASLRIDVTKSIPEFNIDMEGTMAEFTGTIAVMDEEFLEAADAEEKEHHGEESGEEVNHEKLNRNKEYHLLATSFKEVK
jgi:hypothetical protein